MRVNGTLCSIKFVSSICTTASAAFGSAAPVFIRQQVPDFIVNVVLIVLFAVIFSITKRFPEPSEAKILFLNKYFLNLKKNFL